jgi:xylulokinase
MSTVLMGIDLGTTGVKVSLLDEAGNLLGTAYREYAIGVPHAGYAEQDPEDWWAGLAACTHELKSTAGPYFAKVEGIGICGQMHTQVYLDRHDAVLRPAITWMDQRSRDIVERIAGDGPKAALIFSETANSIAGTYTAPNCLWVRENQPEVWDKTASVMVAKDYIKYRLTGEKLTDYSDASGTMLFDIPRRRWSDAMLGLFGVDRNLIPDAAPSAVVMGRINADAASQTGLAEGLPVANGSSDNSASALGAGMVDSGQVTLIIGTAGVVTVCSDKPLPDPRHRVVCWNYCLEDRWVNLGVTQTAGESLNWFKRCFDSAVENRSSGDIFEEYNREVAGIPDGSGGMVFLPYLNGERTPYWDADARGVFFGADLGTRKGHFIKAVMEGVSFALRNNIETVESLGLKVHEVRAVGGGLKSPVWLSSLAKILKRPVRTVPMADTGNWGNALICGKALGIFPSIEDVRIQKQGMLLEESPVGLYEKQYNLFLRLYDDLKDTFKLF